MQPWLRYPSSGTQFCTDMPLSWATVADAAAYKVYMSTDEASLDNNLIGETTGLSIIPSSLTTGTKYFWRVDVVRSDGSIVRGDTWSFASPVKKWVAGKNETEDMFLSGIAFREINSAASRRYLVVGDQGPGAICGVWGGEEGRYAIETAVFNQKLGPNYVGVAVNGKLIDAWLTTDENSGCRPLGKRRQSRQSNHSNLQSFAPNLPRSCKSQLSEYVQRSDCRAKTLSLSPILPLGKNKPAIKRHQSAERICRYIRHENKRHIWRQDFGT